MWRGIPALQGKKVVDISINDSTLPSLCYTVIYRVGVRVGFSLVPRPSSPRPIGKIGEGKMGGGSGTASCSSAGMLAELIKTY